MTGNEVIKELKEILPGPRTGYERIEFENLVGKEIVIREILFLRGRFGEYAWLLIDTGNNELRSTVTGGNVVMEKLKAIRDYLPVRARVVRKKAASGRKYFDLE
ncbi:MAG: hypothetical protein QXH20_02210 [Candidatus Bathyarchaeia archaeon]